MHITRSLSDRLMINIDIRDFEESAKTYGVLEYTQKDVDRALDEIYNSFEHYYVDSVIRKFLAEMIEQAVCEREKHEEEYEEDPLQ